ncbi:vacuolar protein sorting-associated protein [Paramyrothecium foliicola]|nr:vacuolar protein sorting-associated protein [Paramyrothecium foliicola]
MPDLPSLNLDNLAILNDIEGGRVALTSNDNVTSLPTWFLGEAPDNTAKISNATPCIVVLVDNGPLNLDAFYFYFYSYNRGPNISQVLEPIKSLVTDVGDMHVGDHVGDWEYNMIRFQEEKPTGIFYSQHDLGAAYAWADTSLTLSIVFSAYGSHANYPSPGNQIHDDVMLDYCDEGRVWDPTLSAYFYRLDSDTRILTPLPESGSSLSAEANSTSFYYFNGIWGDAQYADDNPIQATVSIFGLKRFVSGPEGPAFKQLVRKGLFPDKLKPKSWTQWLVGAFMPCYRCCLQGWRVWVLGAVFIAVAALAWFGVRRPKQRYRLREYKRLDADIPLDKLTFSDGRGQSRL